MKVLMLNGSAKPQGNTYRALYEVGEQLKKEGIDYEIFQIGAAPLRDCIGCGQCTEKGCVFDDDKVNEFVAKAKEADGLVFGTPVYYAHPSGRVQSFLDRVFYSSGRAFAFKPGASVAVARRGGTSASFDVMNKYFGISQMPVAGSTYWNLVHGRVPGERRAPAGRHPQVLRPGAPGMGRERVPALALRGHAVPRAAPRGHDLPQPLHGPRPAVV